MPNTCRVVEVEKDWGLAHFVSVGFEPARESGDMRGDLGINGRSAKTGNKEDAQFFLWPKGRGSIKRPAVARVRALQTFVEQKRVVHCAGERPRGFEIGEDGRKTVDARPAADRGFEADKTGMRSRAADRSAAVGAESGGNEGRRHTRRAASGRPAGREVGVPGVAS